MVENVMVGYFINTIGLLLLAWTVFAMRKATQMDTIFRLVEHLQTREVVKARKIVLRELDVEGAITNIELNQEQEDAVGLVCSSYDTAGDMIRSGMVPCKPIIANFEDSILPCYRILKQHIDTIQADRKDKGLNYSRRFCEGFEWLHFQAKKLNHRKSRKKSGDTLLIN